MNRPFPAQSGFTLIEVLIAATLLAVMMTLMLGSLRISVTSWTEGERRSAATNRMLVATSFLRTNLRATLPLMNAPTQDRLGSEGDGESADAQSRLVFRGEQSRLQYVGVLPPTVRGGLYRFDLRWQQTDDRSDLKLAIWPLSTGAGENAGEPIDDVTILENVEAFSMTYYRTGEDDGKAQWVKAWAEPILPALIQVDIAVQGEPPWPPLIVAPMLEVRQ